MRIHRDILPVENDSVSFAAILAHPKLRRDGRDEEAWLDEMAWTVPQFSKTKVNWAGEVLVQANVEDYPDHKSYYDEYFRALDIVNNWRSSHSFPLNTFTVGLKRRTKKIAPTTITAQRIKRMSSIEYKLNRFKTMTLSQMQDIGGCRAIMTSVSDVERLVADYRKSEIKHPMHECDDYIANPKESGYRGVHLIYRYNSDRKQTYNTLKIEMQIRTHLQHAWATAVETVGTLQQQALKSSQGEEDWLRFFALTSAAFSHREESPPVPGTPTSYKLSWSRLSEQLFRVDKWSVCRG